MKIITTLIIAFAFTNFVIAQSVEIKDSDDNTLITINDKGDNGGSITLPEAHVPDAGKFELINLAGNLYWDDKKVITEGSSTKYLSVPACAFVPYSNEGPYLYRSWKIEGYPSGNQDLYAPVFLPHGVTISEFAATIYDQEHPTVSIVTIELVRNSMSNSSHTNEIMASLLSTSYSGWDTYTESTIISPTVDNSDYEYFLHLTWDEPTDNFRINFHSARIEYTE